MFERLEGELYSRLQRFAFGDPAELLELAAEAALVGATREQPGRDCRDPSDRLELLRDTRPVAVGLERRARLATQDPAAEPGRETAGRLSFKDRRRALDRPEVDDVGRARAIHRPTDVRHARHATDPFAHALEVRPRRDPTVPRFIAREAFSRRQSWVEGALESAQAVIERLAASG